MNNSPSFINAAAIQSTEAAQQDLRQLAQLVAHYTPADGRFDLPVPGLSVVRASHTTELASHTTSQMGMCIVAQGAKRAALVQDIYDYNESRMVVYAAEVPIKSAITTASPDAPYLCLMVRIDPHKLSELILKVFPEGIGKVPDTRAIYLGKSDGKIVKSAIRLMELILQGDDADLLVPLAIEEILIRLLRSPIGRQIAQIGVADSNAHRISLAIDWLKQHFSESIKVDALAEIARMSPSSFHHHFKSITSMSPLQFQKTLRLQEARNLMVSGSVDVSNAGYQVGYSSVSQFSREYSRLFGMSPSKDIAQRRAV